MESLGKIVLLSGLAVAALAQLGGAIVAFRLGAIHGVLSFLVPGYVLFAAKRGGAYGKVVGTWLAGVVAVVVGMALMS